MSRRNGAVATMVAVLLAVSGVGCGAGRATRIGTSSTGGALMLNGNNDQAWAQAQRLMSSHCEGGYLLVSPGRAYDAVPDGRGAVPASAMARGPMDMGMGPSYGERVDYECIIGLGVVQQPGPVPLASRSPF
jgi:hypothetical protein